MSKVLVGPDDRPGDHTPARLGGGLGDGIGCRRGGGRGRRRPGSGVSHVFVLDRVQGGSLTVSPGHT